MPIFLDCLVFTIILDVTTINFVLILFSFELKRCIILDVTLNVVDAMPINFDFLFLQYQRDVHRPDADHPKGNGLHLGLHPYLCLRDIYET